MAVLVKPGGGVIGTGELVPAAAKTGATAGRPLANAQVFDVETGA